MTAPDTRRRGGDSLGVRTTARFVRDFFASVTDGCAALIYKRLFTPEFESIGDLID